MRRGVCLLLSTVATLGLLVGGGQAQTGAGDEKPGGSVDKKTSLFSRFPGMGGKKAATDKSPPATGKADKQMPGSKGGESKQMEAASSLLHTERENWNRRLDVCIKLRSIADATNDEKLEKMADQLEQMAWDVFLKRTANIATGFAGNSDDARKEKK